MTLYNPVSNCAMSKAIPTPWNNGEILHMSITPAPNFCPRHSCSVRNGNPKMNDKKTNCTMKLTPKWTDSMAKRHMLNNPNVQLRHAIMELKLWGQLPNGLLISGISSSRFLSELLQQKGKKLIYIQQRAEKYSNSCKEHIHFIRASGIEQSKMFINQNSQQVEIYFNLENMQLQLDGAISHFANETIRLLFFKQWC